MKTQSAVILVAILAASTAIADQTVRLSDGSVCTFRNGQFINCTRPTSGATSAAPTTSERYLMQKVENREKLDECLRMADWPGKPGRAECLRLYGR